MNLKVSIIIPSFAGIIFFLFFSCSQVYAARSMIITSSKSSLFGDEELTLSASMSGFTNNETIYIKGAFYNDGSTNYFGLTKYNDNFIKNGESTVTQKQITVGNWDNNLIVKPDFTDSGFIGENTYKLKVGFYYLTSGGNISPVNWSNALDVAISLPDPTATPIIPTNTSIPPSATTIPSPKPTLTKIPTIKPTSVQSKITSSVASISSEILGSSISAKPTETIKNFGNKKKDNNFPLFLLIGGIILLISCIVVTFLIYKKKQNSYE